MKPQINLFIIGEKGFRALEAVWGQFNNSIDLTVIYSYDPGLVDDDVQRITDFCNKFQIKNFDRRKFKIIDDKAKFHLAIGWKWLIRVDPLNLIVFHDSILPKYRGFNPLVTALLNGDKVVGVTALFGDAQYDRGDIIMQLQLKVDEYEPIARAINNISSLYGDLAISIIDKIVKNIKLDGAKQNEALATYSLWRDEDDYFINWNWDSEQVFRFIRATGNPYKGACTYVDNVLIRILDAELVDDCIIANRDVGKLFALEEGNPTIVCGKGLLKILKMTNTENEDFKIKKYRTRFKGRYEI